MRLFIDFLRHEEAATAVEYAVMLAMILMAVIGGIGSVGGETFNMWGSIRDDIDLFFNGP